MTQTPALNQYTPLDIDSLPTRTDLLLGLFEDSPKHQERICAIAKIKSQITISLNELAVTPPSIETCQAVELLFHHAVTRFLKRWRGRSQQQQRQIRFFSHVTGMAIKYYFREEAFKELISAITDMLDGHSQRIKPALTIFLEIVGAIEYSQSQASSNLGRCQFQRHFMSHHLNSMLVLANFCIQKGLIRDGYFSEDMAADEAFQLRAPQQALLAAFRLLHSILCFDWLGQKYNDFEETSDWSSLVIPSKNIKQAGVPQFEKWLKNCEWVRLYEMLIANCRSIQLKLEVVQLIGDMSRIHMKFFKNKNNFKCHIENMAYSFCQILGEIELSRNSEQTIRLGIAVGRNINKLVTTGVGAVIFEINANFFKGLLDAIRKFILQQVIAQEIFNSNLILYYFKFIQGLVYRSRFEKTTGKFEDIEEKVREICRNYEHYIRLLFNRIIKTTQRKSEPPQYRLDCEKLKESIKTYDTKELQIYFLPFRMMKPRYASTSTIQEMFVYVTARIMRAMGLLQYFKLSEWERDLAFEIITQSVDKIFEWFSYTSYRKKYEEKQSSDVKQKSDLPTIRQTFQEQIENEEEYCHFLRLVCFLVIEAFVEQKPLFFTGVSATLFKMIGLVLQLNYGADLQEKESKQMGDESIRLKIQDMLTVCEQVCLKVLLKQLQTKLHNLVNSQKKKYIDYQFVYWNGESNNFQQTHFMQKLNLLQLIAQYCSCSHKLSRTSLLKLQFFICLTIHDDHHLNVNMNLLEYSAILQSLVSTPVLLALTKVGFRKIYMFLQNLLLFLREHSHQMSELVHYLACLRIIGAIKLQNISEEALNKLYVSLKCCLPLLEQPDLITQQLSQELTLITSQLLLPSQELDLKQLGYDIKKILVQSIKKMEKIDMQTTCISFPDIPSFEDSSKSKVKSNDLQSIESQKIEQRKIIQDIQIQSSDKKQKLGDQEQNIYSGYHRDKTMQIINRYVEEQPLPAIISQSQEIDLDQSRKPELQQHVNTHTQEEYEFKPIPMEIEEPEQSINADLKQCIEEIHKLEKQYEHIIQHLEPTDHQKQSIAQNEDKLQELIPYATEQDLQTQIDCLLEIKEIEPERKEVQDKGHTLDMNHNVQETAVGGEQVKNNESYL